MNTTPAHQNQGYNSVDVVVDTGDEVVAAGGAGRELQGSVVSAVRVLPFPLVP